MTIAHESTESQTPPAGWATVTLKGGPFDRRRFNLHQSEDRLVLYTGPISHCYFRMSERDVLHHESVVAGAFGKGAR